MKLNKSFKRFVFPLLVLLVACREDIIEVARSRGEIRAADIAQIDQYILDHNMGTPDTTLNGARYFIVDEGTGDSVTQNAIVSVDYIAYYMNDTIFDTTIPIVADTALNIPNSTVSARVFTYTQTGWPLQFVTFTSQYYNGPYQATALIEALSDALIRMRAGGKLVVFLPSDQATTAYNFVKPEVIYYEFYLRDVL
ncbi:MAG: hypothetical protein OEY56_06455 [Cyclobacteriaceae bacterium]|nr:hypothetical protein [Cyclobacteriaceae bacterium]